MGRRKNNQDSAVVAPELGLFVVADGMGGYEGGEVASRIAVDAIAGFFQRNVRDEDATWPFAMDPSRSLEENMIRVAVKTAHHAIVAERRGRLRNMGTTVVALAVFGAKAAIAHVGDSRAYRLREGRLERLTRDHSYREEIAALRGADPSGEACQAFAHVVTKALGTERGETPDVRVEPLRDGDVYLLCTDGLSEVLDPAAVAEALGESEPAQACEQLVSSAYEAGSNDNITALVVRIART